MRSSRAKTAAQRAPRRWRTPPPLTRGSETLEGMDLLREVGGETGVLLWQAYRNVMFWSTTEEEARGKLFAADAGKKRREEIRAANLPDELVDPLTTLAGLLDTPADASAGELAEACRTIATWAEREGHPVTALSFTQAAALAAPRDASLSLRVGQLARRQGDMPRAETWFRHTIMIGRQTGDWDSYSRAYIALGNMLIQRGNFPGAQRMHIKALRASKRKGLRETQAMALHDMFVIAMETGRNEQAEEYARQAFRAYGPDHRRLPGLANDIAYFWMNRGYFERALPVFLALDPHLTAPSDHVSLVANVARAAGGAGHRDLFRKAWVEVTRMAKEPAIQDVIAACLLELARGAAMLGEWDRAEQAAEQSLRVATEQKQAKITASAESLLESVQGGRATEARSVAAPVQVSPRSDALADDLVRSLGSATETAPV